MGKRKYLALVLLLGAAAASAVFAVTAFGRSSTWPFRSVTPADLSPVGLTLTPATPPAHLRITAADAATAAHNFQGWRAQEEHFMYCADPNLGPRRLHRDCWALSMKARGYRFDLVLVDAATGKVIAGFPGYYPGGGTQAP